MMKINWKVSSNKEKQIEKLAIMGLEICWTVWVAITCLP